jgi:xanthosine phosphorylase
MSINSQQARAARAIKARYPDFTPKVGIILGSGLGALAEHIEEAFEIPYDELPGFSESTVEGHDGCLVLGHLRGVPVACLKGRRHYYEGISNPMVQTLVRTLKLLGCEILLATNAAGSMQEAAGPGSLMLIEDHINFSFNNPLVGRNDDEFGPRFFDMNNAYNPELRALMQTTAEEENITLHKGVYLGVLGPSFETPAEINVFKQWGAGAVGMSTVPEVIVARHCGLKVVVVSAITNYAAGMGDTELNHDETLYYANVASKDMLCLVENFIEKCKNLK